MRILSKRQVRELLLYSLQHIARLEAAGKFPKRITLGPNRSVGWSRRFSTGSRSALIDETIRAE